MVECKIVSVVDKGDTNPPCVEIAYEIIIISVIIRVKYCSGVKVNTSNT